VKYLSTRGDATPRGFGDILLEGLAPDGGLYLPTHYPQVDAATLARWRGLPYAELAFEILSLYVDDIPADDLRTLLRRTYTREVFGSDAIVPLEPLGQGLYLQALSNGPTLAFKDIAMQLLGALFEYALARRGGELNILGATSGDTGSAAEHAMRGKQGIRVFMLSPHGRMSEFQQAQMYSLQDANIHNLAIEGVFDDCQDIVKAIGSDLAFKRRWAIGTVNSINWARLLAQVVYYFAGYFQATRGDAERVSFAVPSGNFGNICAGHIARMMGLPIARLVCATNENDVLDEFFRSGVYRVRSEVPRHGGFALAPAEHARVAADGFVSGRSTHADRLRTIRQTWQQHGVLVDPHTADGLLVAQAYREPGVPMLVLETAQPAKFAQTIREALGREPGRPPGYEGIEALPRRCTVLPAQAAAVRHYIEEACSA